MIDKNEIEAKAREFDIHVANVQRDYVFGWLLVGIFSQSSLNDTLVLKGGNCFRKAYFPTSRYSGDLDFSTESSLDPNVFLSELNRVCDFIEREAGIRFDKERNKTEAKDRAGGDGVIYQARLYFKDFYGNPDHITISVRLDVTQFDRIYLPVQTRKLIHPYSDASSCSAEIKCHKLEEILATKLKCLLQRRHIADLYDYVYSVFINRDVEVNRSEVASTFLRKTIFEPSPGMAKALLLELPFDLFQQVWSRYIVCPRESRIDFKSAISNFKMSIEQLFAGAVVTPSAEATFFPASLRNPIMQAATTMTLLEFEYDGYQRLVEPYSLVFKRRKHGPGREYFYGYDQRGGSSGPGIKTFLHTKIESIENTEQKFEARVPVELTKAGEFGDKTHFGSPFGAGRRRRTMSSSGRSRRRYLVECSYCGRQFKRVKRSTTMRKHNDEYGNDCYGRRGHVVDTYYE